LSFMAKVLDFGSWFASFDVVVHDVLLVGLGSYISVPSCGCHFHMYALRLSTLYIRLLISTRCKVYRFTFSYQNMRTKTTSRLSGPWKEWPEGAFEKPKGNRSIVN